MSSAPQQRQRILLALLAIVFVGAVFALRRGGDPAAGGAQPSNPAQTAAGAAENVPVADLRLDSLEASRDDLQPPTRNPFRFQAWAPPPAPPRPAVAPRPVVIAPPPVPSGPPPPPPIALKFIGILEASRAGKVAILSDSRGNVFYGKEGDITEGRYQLLKIGVESAEMAYADGRGRQTIRLSGQ